MVKALADILSEIEERELIRSFSMGGSPDEAQDAQYGGDTFSDTPSDPGQDDTLDESDQGLATDEDWAGLEAATIDTRGPITPSEKRQAAAAYIGNETDRIVEEALYHQRNPEYMSLITQNPNITTQGLLSSIMDTEKSKREEKTFADYVLTALKTAGWAAAPFSGGITALGSALTPSTTGLFGGRKGFSVDLDPFGLAQTLAKEAGLIDKNIVDPIELAEFARPSSTPPPSDIMTAQAPRADMPIAAPPSLAPPSVKDELVATAKASPSQVAAAPATPAAPAPAVEDIVEQMAPTPRDEVPTVDRPSSFNISPLEPAIDVSTITQSQAQPSAPISTASLAPMAPVSPAEVATLTPSKTDPTNTGMDIEDPHYETKPSSTMTLAQAKEAGSQVISDLADLFSINKDNQTAVAQVNPLPSTSKSSKTSTGTPPPDSGEGGNDQEDIITTAIVNNIIDTPVGEKEKEAEQVSKWSFDPSMWYPAAQGGAIDAFSVGGLAGMMMPRQQLSTRYNSRPPQFGGQIPPQPPQFPGFIGPFGPQRPPLQPPQHPKLDAETYFHTHEGGKVAYPNFPQPYVNPENKPNPFKPRLDPIVDPIRPSRPFQTYPQPVLDEAVINQMDTNEQQPVPPVSISETTATALQPEEIQETQTTIEEAPVPREIDIQMPQNITATLDFPEQVRGKTIYAKGGDIPTEEQMKRDDEVVQKLKRIQEIENEMRKIDEELKKNFNFLEELGLLPKKQKPSTIEIDEEEFYKQQNYLDYLDTLPKEQQRGLMKMPITIAQGGEIPAAYAHGGLTGLAHNYPEKYGIGGFLKRLAPMAAGFLAGPLGYIPSMLAGAGTGYALAGKKRSGLDALKGLLSGYAGSGLGRLGSSIAGGADMTSAKAIGDAMTKSGTGFKGVFDVAKAGSSDYFNQLGSQFSGVGKGITAFNPAAYQAMGKNLVGPATAAITAASITPPSEMPEFTEVEVEQIKTMTPEQRRAYIESKRKQYANRTMQPTTFAPPNVDIGFDVTTAADGGVMEIDEEMESGSFVLPADVVSNVGDGSSDAGHRRLAQLFGGGDDYAIGGGTGILKGPIKGPGGGLDDLIQTGIDGVRVARLSTDEFVVPKDVVRKLGGGSQKAGSEKLYDFMKDVRLKKHGTTEQPKEIHMSGLRKMV
jgi:hypothetical protein